MPENENATYFTKEMAKEYTILAPPLFPIHEQLFLPLINEWGYNIKMMENTGENVMRKGLKYCHNDTCYPAQIVIGEMMDSIESGKYDVHKLAFIITQTGGGCRASNYISLMRKALSNAGYSFIPIISFNFQRDLEQSGFRLTIPMLYRMLYYVIAGDIIMTLKNQCLPYEAVSGITEKKVDFWIEEFRLRFPRHKFFSYSDILKCYREIVEDFDSIKLNSVKKVKVGIVGEIFVKFSPYGNNELEKFLIDEGAEPVIGGVVDFCLYCISNGITDYQLYGEKSVKAFLQWIGLKILEKKQNDARKVIEKFSTFTPMPSFSDIMKSRKGFISKGVKMGEGWLLTAEMLDLCENGVKNIVCAQPFGCLPNHIVGKGMIKGIKDKVQDANIVSVDYDFSSTKANQENRIKLMLENAKKNLNQTDGKDFLFVEKEPEIING